MSIFDHKTIDQHVQELDEHIQHELNIQNTLAGCLTPGATILESLDPEIAINKLVAMLQPNYQVLGSGLEAEWLQKQQGRPVIRWDVKTFRCRCRRVYVHIVQTFERSEACDYNR